MSANTSTPTSANGSVTTARVSNAMTTIASEPETSEVPRETNASHHDVVNQARRGLRGMNKPLSCIWFTSVQQPDALPV